MANPHYRNILFPATRFPGGQRKLTIKFQFNSEGANVDYQAGSLNLFIEKYGVLEYRWDIDDLLMVPGMMSFEFFDLNGSDPSANSLANFLTSTSFSTYTKRPEVVLEIDRGSGFVEEFSGNVIERTIQYDPVSKKLLFTVAPQTDLLNKYMLYDGSGTAVNPFSYSSGNYYFLHKVLEDIYKKVNPAISYSGGSLLLEHDWKFRGSSVAGVGLYEFNLFELPEVQIKVNNLFFTNQYGINSLGDALRVLAKEFCCLTGMTDNKNAFFKKLFVLDDNPKEILQTDLIQVERKYLFSLIDYIKVTPPQSGLEGWNPTPPATMGISEEGAFTTVEERFLELDTVFEFWEEDYYEPSDLFRTNVRTKTDRALYSFIAPADLTEAHEGDLYSNNGSIFKISHDTVTAYLSGSRYIWGERVEGTNEPDESGELMLEAGTGSSSIYYDDADKMSASYNDFYVLLGRDTRVYSGFISKASLTAKFWYKLRSMSGNAMVMNFRLRGTDWPYTRNVIYKGVQYQPLSMRRDYDKNTTEIESIMIS